MTCNVHIREEKIACWYHNPERQYIEYILGPVVDDFLDVPEEMFPVTLPGGMYAVFETENVSDKEDFVEILRMYTRCVFYGWVKEFRETGRM